MEGDKGWCVVVCALLLSFLVGGCGYADKVADKCYTGVFVESGQSDLSHVRGFEASAGAKVAQVMWFVDWAGAFPLDECKRLWSLKYVPHVTWEPWYWNSDGIRLKDITDGKYDDYIGQWADDIKNYGGPVFIRWGHEFNGTWYPWCLNTNDPVQYARTFRYIVDFFRRRGVGNVKWIWCPVVNFALPEESYPGRDYVDWIGLDVYNFGETPPGTNGWEGFDKLFYNTYKLMRTRYPGHPIMIAEMGCTQQGGNKAGWITDFGQALKNRYPGVLSFIWFNLCKEADWRIESSAASRDAFRALVSDGRYSSDARGLWAVPSDALEDVKDIWQTGSGAKADVPAYKLARKNFDITVDGSLDEWKGVPALRIEDRTRIVIGPSVWGSGEDLSANAMLVWDDKGLYLGIRLLDDDPLINRQDADLIWNGDCVELCLGVDPDAPFARMDFLPSDFQIGFGLKEEGARVFVWRGDAGSAEAISARSAVCDGGCGLEVFIPWAVLGVSDAASLAGRDIRLNIALDDADRKDGGSRRVQMSWAGGADFYLFPCLWGKGEMES